MGEDKFGTMSTDVVGNTALYKHNCLDIVSTQEMVHLEKKKFPSS